ncbi:MAG TPA: pentapeptide repeat-containing protein [Methyloceanibacter sp.]|nr:pentapeptide repeat-containing protein [Methyloceanibacter sp.]
MADQPKLADDVKGYLDEANATSEPARTAWLAFLVLLTYVIVTLASVSHKDLLLNSPVKLPIINADIPLVGFFQYAPAMLLLVYLSLLVQHVIVARKYRRFTDAIIPLERESGSENPARERVHAYAFSQILAGPRPHRITKLMMQLIVYVTFAALPIATLLYFQIKFLPYHEVWITYWHRVAVILGFAMLILLTPIMQHAPPKRKWDLRLGPPAEAWEASSRQVVMIFVLLPVVLGFSWLIATVPDEWIDRRLGFVAPASAAIGPEGEAKLLNPLLRRLFYDRLPDDGSKGWWRRFLLSYRVLIVEDTDLGIAAPANLVLRERNFRYALLNRSDFHRADLTWADLRAAQLWRTTMRGKLNDTKLQGAVLKEAELQGAQLASASLQGADLSSAALQGAILSYARLQGANLRGAQLQGADLRFAQAQGADLEGAQLQDADLEGAALQGAVVSGAEIWLAKFPRALAEQRPVPLGLADVKMSAPTVEAKAQLKQGLETDITDPELRGVVMVRLGNILSNEPLNWVDAANWEDYVHSATPPSAQELAAFHARLACDDPSGAIAAGIAGRAKDFEAEHFGRGYAQPLAQALLDESCAGGTALTPATRAALEGLAQAPE